MGREPETAADLMAVEGERERARVLREGPEPIPGQFDDDPPTPLDLAEETWEWEQAQRRRR